jgi:hypothetical protein
MTNRFFVLETRVSGKRYLSPILDVLHEICIGANCHETVAVTRLQDGKTLRCKDTGTCWRLANEWDSATPEPIPGTTYLPPVVPLPVPQPQPRSMRKSLERYRILS